MTLGMVHGSSGVASGTTWKGLCDPLHRGATPCMDPEVSAHHSPGRMISCKDAQYFGHVYIVLQCFIIYMGLYGPLSVSAG